MPDLYLGKQTIVKNNDWNFGNADIRGANSIVVDGNIMSMPPDFDSLGVNWTDISLNERNYNSIATSSSGKYCSTTVQGGVIYNTTDYGITWTQSNNAPNANWKKIAISANGQYQSACIQNGSIMHSSDYGVNWLTSNAVAVNWSDITISASGKYQSACVNVGNISYSNDFGVTWTQSNAPSDTWSAISMSSKGNLQTAVSLQHIYRSTDYGVTWSVSSGDIITNATSMIMSSDGNRQTITGTNGVYFSDTSGNNWTTSVDMTNITMNCITSSATSEHQSIGTDASGVFMSSDYGKTWKVSNSVSSYWVDIAMSSTGQHTYVISSNSAKTSGSIKKTILENALVYSLSGGGNANTVSVQNVVGNGESGPTGATGPNSTGIVNLYESAFSGESSFFGQLNQFGDDGGALDPSNPYAFEVTTESWNGTTTTVAGPTGYTGPLGPTGQTGSTGIVPAGIVNLYESAFSGESSFFGQLNQFGDDGGALNPSNPFAFEVTTESWDGTTTTVAGPTGIKGPTGATGANSAGIVNLYDSAFSGESSFFGTMEQFGNDGGELNPNNPYAFEVTTDNWNGTTTTVAGPTGPAGGGTAGKLLFYTDITYSRNSNSWGTLEMYSQHYYRNGSSTSDNPIGTLTSSTWVGNNWFYGTPVTDVSSNGVWTSGMGIYHTQLVVPMGTPSVLSIQFGGWMCNDSTGEGIMTITRGGTKVYQRNRTAPIYSCNAWSVEHIWNDFQPGDIITFYINGNNGATRASAPIIDNHAFEYNTGTSGAGKFYNRTPGLKITSLI